MAASSASIADTLSTASTASTATSTATATSTTIFFDGVRVGGRVVRLCSVFRSDGVIIAVATATAGGDRSIAGVAAAAVIIVHQRA